MENQNFQNNLVKNENKAVVKRMPFSAFMNTIGTKLVSNTLVDPKRNQQFVANLVSAVSNNPTLAECDQTSIVSAALQAEALHFPINNALGYVYLVPFDKKVYNEQTHKRESVGKVAQFQIGYKGYIQLAIRSGQYRNIDVTEVKEGELGEFNPLDGQQFNWVSDYYRRKKLKTIGYVGQLELMNGFKKQVYFSYEEMLDHANTYSQAFDAEIYKRLQNGERIMENGKDVSWKFSSFWYKNFDEMAKKTVIRQLLSKWGIMSIEMQEAYVKDQAEMKTDGTYDYIDAKIASNQVEEEQQRRMASVKVNAATDEVNNPVEPNENSNLNSNAAPDFDPMSLEI